MRKTASSIVLLVLFLTAVLVVRSAHSNIMPYTPPKITLLSPLPDETYHSSSVSLKVRVQIFGKTPQSLEHLDWLNYSLDGKEDVRIPFVYPSSYGPGYCLTRNGTLSAISDGIHSVTVRGETTIGAEQKGFQESISFTTSTEHTPETSQALQLTIIVGTVIAVAAASAVLIVSRKKHKRG